MAKPPKDIIIPEPKEPDLEEIMTRLRKGIVELVEAGIAEAAENARPPGDSQGGGHWFAKSKAEGEIEEALRLLAGRIQP